MLVYHPTFLFLGPGLAMFTAGALIMALVFANVSILGHGLSSARAARWLRARRGCDAADRVRAARARVWRLSAPAIATRSWRAFNAAFGLSMAFSLAQSSHLRESGSRLGFSPNGLRAGWEASQSETAHGARWHARDRGDADLLHVVPAVSDRSPPAAPRRRLSFQGSPLGRRRPGCDQRDDHPDRRQEDDRRTHRPSELAAPQWAKCGQEEEGREGDRSLRASGALVVLVDDVREEDHEDERVRDDEGRGECRSCA